MPRQTVGLSAELPLGRESEWVPDREERLVAVDDGGTAGERPPGAAELEAAIRSEDVVRESPATGAEDLRPALGQLPPSRFRK